MTMSARAVPLGNEPVAGFDVERIRREFPILALQVHGKPLVFLDNAASSQMPQRVIDRYVKYRSSEHANIHRGVHYLSEVASDPIACIVRDAPDVPTMALLRAMVQMKQAGEFDEILARYR